MFCFVSLWNCPGFDFAAGGVGCVCIRFPGCLKMCNILVCHPVQDFVVGLDI